VIITRTPFPICLAGGGTDVPSFYRESGGGGVTGLAIDRFVHVLVSERHDPLIRVAYSKTENVTAVDELEHGLVRECLRLTQIHRAVEVHAVTDLPGEGSVKGASSSLGVGLLNALYRYKGQVADASLLAEDASRIEVNILHGTPGKWAQYTAAFGGLHYLEFRSDDTVRVQPIGMSPDGWEALSERLSLFYASGTPGSRTAPPEPAAGTLASRDRRLRSRELAGAMRDALVARDWDRVGRLLDEGQGLERGPGTPGGSGGPDDWYAQALEAGALGGTVLGAGEGAFLLLFHPPERSAQVAKALMRLERMPVRISPEGSRVLTVHG
jgi:D-glycero-alpha-D-manno-heptose-7-phosphate kinase